MLKTVQLGKNSGLNVSRLCLGTMNFGEPGRGHQADWTLGPDHARPSFKAAIDRGHELDGATAQSIRLIASQSAFRSLCERTQSICRSARTAAVGCASSRM